MDDRQIGIYYLNRRAYGRAEHHLRQWVLSHPNDVYTHMQLIWCFGKHPSRGLHRWPKCDEFYQNTYDRPNGSLLFRFVTAEQMFYEGEKEEAIEEAIEEYKAAIDLGLDVPTLHHRLGVALQKVKRYSEAQTEFEAVLSVDPIFIPTLVTYGSWLFSESRFDRLEDLVEQLSEYKDDAFSFAFTNADEGFAWSQKRCGGVTKDGMPNEREQDARSSSYILASVQETHEQLHFY